MLHLRVYGHADSLTRIGRDGEDRGAARNVALAPGVRAGYVLLSAEVFAESADAHLDHHDPRRGVSRVAAGIGEATKAWGALAVLGTNVAMLLAAGTLTLVVQRRLAAGGNAARLRRVIRSVS
jgi:hypothetical protein